MRPFDFHCSTRIVFGPGRVGELGSLTAGLGGSRVLVVSDPGIEKAGHTQRAIDSLHAAGLRTLVFDRLQENPTTDNVGDGRAVAADYRPDVLIAVGGGSSMDCAKGINFLHSCGGRMQDYWGVGKATGPMLPMVAVPTTAGTGSEAQSFALISDAATHAKMACGDKRAAFRIAILDPELTLTMPQRVAALSGMDAISHAVETKVTKKRNAVSEAFSNKAWWLMADAFQPSMNSEMHAELAKLPDGEKAWLKLRSRMQTGAFFAGMAIENSMLGAAHALANPLTASFGIAHGEAVGIMLPHVVRRNGRDTVWIASAYREFVAPFAEEPCGLEEAPHQLAGFLAELVQSAGLAGKLSEVGVDRERLPALAEDAAKQWTGTFNPVEMTPDDYLKCYEAAY